MRGTWCSECACIEWDVCDVACRAVNQEKRNVHMNKSEEREREEQGEGEGVGVKTYIYKISIDVI